MRKKVPFDDLEVGTIYLAEWVLKHTISESQAIVEILEKSNSRVRYKWLDGHSSKNRLYLKKSEERELIYCDVLNSPLAKVMREEK